MIHQPLVSIIILTYSNGLPQLKKCLISLKKISYTPVEIILVDNASTDKTISFVKKHYPYIRLVQNKSNLGFCEGNNQGFKKAKGKYILFLNNDCEVTKHVLSVLVSVLERDKEVGAVQPKIRQLIKKDKLDACASYLTMTGFLYHYGYSQQQKKKQYNKKLEIYSVKGACFLARREVVKKVGLFDEAYFAYFEETDFCHRVWLAGYSILYEPSAEVFHLGGGQHVEVIKTSIQLDAYKNRIATYVKNLSLLSLIKILPLHLFLCVGIGGVYLLQGKPQLFTSIIGAIIWNFHNRRVLIKKRNYVQKKLRRISDTVLFSHIKKDPPLSYWKHFFSNPRGKYIDIEL
jgi:GT2 family glycosyltransferase